MVLLWYMSFGAHMHTLLWGTYLGVEWLGYKVCMFSFSRYAGQFVQPALVVQPAVGEILSCPMSVLTHEIFSFIVALLVGA